MHLNLLVDATGFKKRRTPSIKEENKIINFDIKISTAIWLIILLIIFCCVAKH